MSPVTCHLSPVTCHMSLTPTATATATDPPPANPGRDQSYKFDYCIEINFKKPEQYNHNKSTHKKCTVCAKVCPTQNSFENHMKAIHNKSSLKHTLEREPSLKTYKNKYTIKIWKQIGEEKQ